MKINEKTVNLLIIIFVVAIIGVVYFKFVIPRKIGNKGSASFKIDQISLLDLNGRKHLMKDLLKSSQPTYCLIFRLEDCWSCTVKGLNDIDSLKQSGIETIIIVVHRSFEDVKGWSQNYLKYKFYFLDINNFFENIKFPMTPILIKFRGDKLIDYKYETI